jgi:LytS/YehU family sensor histidine kinase
LGDMMRFMLHENSRDFIPMHKELDYLQNYIALQKSRIQLSPQLEIVDNLAEANCGGAIAPMMLIPFIENAFKHGISLNNKSWILINLQCDGQTLKFEVKNSIHRDRGQDTEKDKSGIGLENVKERLRLMYPELHKLDVYSGETEFSILLELYKTNQPC